MQHLLAVFITIASIFFPNDHEKQKITDLQQEAKKYFNIDLDSSAFYAHQALMEAKEVGYTLGQSRSHFLLGAIGNAQNKPSQSVTHFLKALNLYATIEGDKSLTDQAKICLSLGKIYREHYKIAEAIEYYDKGLEFALEAIDQKIFVKLLHNKAIAYR